MVTILILHLPAMMTIKYSHPSDNPSQTSFIPPSLLPTHSCDILQEKVLSASALLVATGRIPNVSDLNLEAAGVKYNKRRGVTVNQMLETRYK
jgi:hypothetical protein